MPEIGEGESIATARALLQDALEALNAERWDLAVRGAGEALAIAPIRGLQLVALDVLAVGHHALGNFDAACTSAIEALRSGSIDSHSVILEIARTYASEGDSGRCAALLEEAHAACPTLTPIVATLATQAHLAGNYPSALKWYAELDRLDPAGAPERLAAVEDLRETVERNAVTRSILDQIGIRIGVVAKHQVTFGPFAGQRLEYDHDFSWVASLVGCYEMELHPAIEHAIAARPHRVINVGCSGGYYAVGFARRLPDTHVVAFDIDATAREACVRAAQANGVGGRVEVKAACTPHDLQALAGPGTLVFSDCEGYELQLLDPANVPALRETSIIVELHDVWVPDLSPRLLARFARTHDISRVAVVPRDGHRFPILLHAGLTEFEMSLAVSDFRAPSMTWAYMVPRAG